MTIENIKLDVNFVRSQFPAFSDPLSKDWLFFENPKGKYNSKDNKNQWQIVRDSTICSIAIYKAQKEFGSNIIADNKLNKKGKVLINAEFITEYLPRLNKDEQKTPLYLSFAEMKKVCLN